jgi:hypothetical protein
MQYMPIVVVLVLLVLVLGLRVWWG